MADVMLRFALLSDDEQYRYTLARRWGDAVLAEDVRDVPCVLWVMLNPSMADMHIDDPTVGKCVEFSSRWGFESLMIVNLFALRTPYPANLLEHPDPRGPDNARFVRQAIHSNRITQIVCAWGAFNSRGKLRRLNIEKMCREAGKVPLCLGRTSSGAPRHPGRIGYNTQLEEFA